MAESTERAQKNLNTFRESMDSKTIEKETVNVKETEIDSSSSSASIAYDIDERIANIQAEAVMATSMESAADNNGGVKPCNLDIAAALNSTSESSSGEGTSSDTSNRTSLSECHLAGENAEKMARDARLHAAMGQDFLDTMTATIQVLQSQIGAFSEKAVEASGRGTEHGYRVADFYHNMTSKYESTVRAFKRKAARVEASVNRAEEAAKECQRYAELAEEITDETLEKSKRIKFSAYFWTSKGKAAIIVSLKKEHSALLMMRRLWKDVRSDMEYEERYAAEDSDEETRQCQNRERKTKIGHIVTTLLGLALLSVTSLFKVGSDSFNAILALGVLTTGWCFVYWVHKLYKCLKEPGNEQTEPEAAPEEDEVKDSFLENCERRLEIVRSRLLKYNILVDSDAESDMDSVETAAGDEGSHQ